MGRSPSLRPLEGDTIPEMATRILASAPPPFALAGISMGGYSASRSCDSGAPSSRLAALEFAERACTRLHHFFSRDFWPCSTTRRLPSDFGIGSGTAESVIVGFRLTVLR